MTKMNKMTWFTITNKKNDQMNMLQSDKKLNFYSTFKTDVSR